MIQELSPEDISQQLCVYNSELFKKINPIEFLNQIWRKPTDEQDFLTPSLDFFIKRFDKESYWAATEIVGVKDLKKRALVLNKFIRVAKVCSPIIKFYTTSIFCNITVMPGV